MKKKEFTYWRSTFTGECYCFPVEMGVPGYEGWEPITEQTFHKWEREHGLEV